MHKQGFSTRVKQAVAATGGLFVLGALWRMPHGQPSAALVGLCIAVPVHAASRFVTGGLAVGFVTVETRWRAWARIMLNALLVSFVGAGAVGLCAKLCAFFGVNVLVIAAPLAAIGCTAWDA